jgi:hypothetical protein
MQITRRSFIDRTLAASVLTLAYSVGGVQLLLSPKDARAQRVPLRHLDPDQLLVLERLGEVILPGSAEMGLAHFIDHQLGEEPDDSLLIAKYFQVRPPYKDFYKTGLKVVANKARQVGGRPFAEVSDSEIESIVQEMATPGLLLTGFPVNLFYICLRSDAVDVTYGTPGGFSRLNIPYMEHIKPPEGWNG